MNRQLFFLVIVCLVLAACGPKQPVPAATEGLPVETQAPPTPEPSPTLPPTAPPSPTPAGPPTLPPEPQEIRFQAEDGQELLGLYYPAAVNPAPLVVFIHWVGGDKADWYEIAPWLQNRGLDNPYENPGQAPWWDPSWFPPVPQGISYAVFIFSLRTCEPYPAGCSGWDGAAWLRDIKAALLTASDLEGVDPTRVVTIGSSIGADGAADGCYLLNEVRPGSCQGALSLSPGNYLGVRYADAVRKLEAEQPPKPVWCFYGAGDREASPTCKSASGTVYKSYEFPGDLHGNLLLVPGIEPLPMQLILDFLAQTVGE
jgi:dienelactone hydrolase